MHTILNHMKAVLQESNGDARRVLHGRGHHFSGFEHLTIDYFAPDCFIISYRELTLYERTQLIDTLATLIGPPLKNIILQERLGKKVSFSALKGSIPVAPSAQENGLRYHLKFDGRQNIGFFPDMRCGRELVSQLSPGKRIANLFSFTCAFSVVAKAAGASYICNLDMSKPALELGRKNHRLNGLSLENIDFMPYELFRSFNRLSRRGPFDIVIIDPPSFQYGHFNATKDYPRLLRRIDKLLAPGGSVIACLNAPSLDSSFLHTSFRENASFLTHAQSLQRPIEFIDCNAEAGLKIHLYSDQGTRANNR